jgi:NADH-quinone oxidoreductase subunit M
MMSVYLVILPLIAALIALFSQKQSKNLALLSSLLTAGVACLMLSGFDPMAGMQYMVNYDWIPQWGIKFALGIDGVSIIPVLITAFVFPLIMLSTYRKDMDKSNAFYALALVMQSALFGVFMALDAFVFYIFWEAALLPIYFICAFWGGENRIKITFKFFIYTLIGSLFMLIGMIYIYQQLPSPDFSLSAFQGIQLSTEAQLWVFLSFMIAFGIKIPIFPLHTWQPNTYTESPVGGTMLLSAIMLKMGLFGILRWVLLITPDAASQYGHYVVILAIIGLVYASIIAFMQEDAKRLIAFSSIAHVGLMAAAAFSGNIQGLQGLGIQMLNHAIYVIGLFLVVDIVEEKTGTRIIAKIKGLVHQNTFLAVTGLIIVMGAVALPLTNGFVGEFLLLMGVFSYSSTWGIVAGLTIILGAVYMLRMYQSVFFGESKAAIFQLSWVEKITLGIIVLAIIGIGVYPNPVLELSAKGMQSLLDQIELKQALTASGI